MRIIAGKFKGKKLAGFVLNNKSDLRPTSDRNRESLFNIVCNSHVLTDNGFNLEEANILDGFSGTGAIGLEFLSRGAKSVTFIDNNRKNLDIVRENVGILGVEKDTNLICDDIAKGLRRSSQKYSLVFLDPPYKMNIIEDTVNNLFEKGFIGENTILVIETNSKTNINLPENFKLIDERKYGKTIFRFFLL